MNGGVGDFSESDEKCKEQEINLF